MKMRVFLSHGHSAGIFWAISAGLILALPIHNARANELFSESVYVLPVKTAPAATDATSPVTPDPWKHFQILLAGDPTLPTQDATDINTDPFADDVTSTITASNPFPFPVDATAQPVGPGPTALTGLTDVNFGGSTGINPANIPAQKLDNPAGEVQFGLEGPDDNTPLQIIGQHWGAEPISVRGKPFSKMVPVVSVTPNPAPPATAPDGQSFQYIVDFIQFTQHGIEGTEWVEFPYLSGQQPTFTYSDWGDPYYQVHVTDTEIQLSSTLIPLDDLNFADDPLAGSTAVPAFSDEQNAADIVTTVPEPGSMSLMVFGLAVLSRRREKKKRTSLI